MNTSPEARQSALEGAVRAFAKARTEWVDSEYQFRAIVSKAIDTATAKLSDELNIAQGQIVEQGDVIAKLREELDESRKLSNPHELHECPSKGICEQCRLRRQLAHQQPSAETRDVIPAEEVKKRYKQFADLAGVPQDFIDGMRDVAEGNVVNLDTALTKPFPPTPDVENWSLETIDNDKDRITLWIGAQPINFHTNETWKVKTIVEKHNDALAHQQPSAGDWGDERPSTWREPSAGPAKIATRDDVKDIYAEGLQVGMALGKQQSSTTTADVEKIAREAAKKLPTGPEADAYPKAVRVVVEALAQAREPLVLALKQINEEGNIEEIWRIASTALTGTGEK